MKEIWKDINGYKGRYQVSNKGKVKSLPKKTANRWGEFMTKEKILNPTLFNTGYLCVGLYKHKKMKLFTVHRLVAESYISNPKNKPQVNHKDGDKLNNTASNLEWVTHKEQCLHAWNTGLNKNKGENHYSTKLSRNDVLDIRNAYRLGCFYQRELAKAYGVSQPTINRIVNKRGWKDI